METILCIILAFLLGAIPAVIADRKGKNFTLWLFFGAALFIVALPMALLITPERGAEDRQKRQAGMIKCPFCAEYIKKEAVVCRFCGRSISKAITPGYKPFSGGTVAKRKKTPAVPYIKTDKGWIKPPENEGKKQIRLPSSALASRTSKIQIRLPATGRPSTIQKDSESQEVPLPASETTPEAPETPVDGQVSVPCPYCQVSIDITGLPPGTYECPNCQGKISLE